MKEKEKRCGVNSWQAEPDVARRGENVRSGAPGSGLVWLLSRPLCRPA